MKSFGKRLIPFFLCAALFWMLGWYQANFHAPEGDLVRSSFLITTRHYPDPIQLPPARDTTARNILLIGDSHLDQSPLTRRFQNHLDIEVSSNSCWAYESPNPFLLGLALARETNPDLLVIEVVERNLVPFASDFCRQDNILEPKIKGTSPKRKNSGFHHLGNGVRTAASILTIRHRWYQNDKCRTVPSTKYIPLYSHDEIHLINKVWSRPPAQEATTVLKELKDALSNQLGTRGIDFFIYVIPDKATVYHDFFDSADLPPSFLLEKSLPPDIYSPILDMREAINAGTMEVYKYSDTHLGEAGAQITGAHLSGILQQRNERHSTLNITN